MEYLIKLRKKLVNCSKLKVDMRKNVKNQIEIGISINSNLLK